MAGATRQAAEGRFGDDFLQRAADQSLAGITANDPAEAVYLVNFDDAHGAKLSPQGCYELRFGAGDLPPVDSFWSLAAYTAQDMNLIPNPGQRYSVGDRTPGLGARAGRRADHLPAARLARQGAGTELAAHLRSAPVVRDLADVPAPARGDRGQVGMPGHHPGHLNTPGARRHLQAPPVTNIGESIEKEYGS